MAQIEMRSRLPLSALSWGCVLLVFMTGCSQKIGPDFVEPEIPTASDWLNAGKSGIKKGPVRNWWTLFEDPTLNRLIDRAYKNNLGVQAAALRIMEARAKLGIARSFLFPQFGELRADGLYERLSEQSPYEQGLKDYSFPYYQTGFDTAWEIDIWGKFRRGIEASAAKLAAETLEYDDVLVSLTAEVASAYIQIRTFEERLRIARENADLQKKTFHIAESQFRNGINTELDMQQANALQQKTLAEITHIETGLRQSRNALCQLLGLPPTNLEHELADSRGIPEARSSDDFGIPADVLRRRPDVRKAAFEAAAESAHIGIAKSELLPSLTLVGSVGFASGQVDAVDAMNALSPSGLAAKFGPTIRWPVLQFGRLKNNVRAQDAKFQSTLTRYRNVVLHALREVEDGLIDYRQSIHRVNRLREGVASSRRAADLALLQYQNGLEDYTRVLNSELFLVEQQDMLIASQGDIAKSLILVYKALGGGWEIRDGKPLVPEDTLRLMKERTDWGDLLDETPQELFRHQESPMNPDPKPVFEGVL